MADQPRQSSTRYFDALARRDLDAMCAVLGRRRRGAHRRPGRRRRARRACAASSPSCSPRSRTSSCSVRRLVADGDRVAVRWGAAGTFAGPGAFHGIAATGARVTLEGIDLLRVRDGLIVRNDAFADGMASPGRSGCCRPRDSARRAGACARRSTRARAAALALAAGRPEPVADGVWRVRGGLPAAHLQRLPRARRRRRAALRRRIAADGHGDRAAAGAARRAHPRRPRPRPRRPPRRGAGARRAGALPRRRASPTPRATAAATTRASATSAAPVKWLMHEAARALGRRAGRDRRDARRGRRRRGLRGRPPARPRARPDRPVARARPARAHVGHLLHARHRHRPQGRAEGPGHAANLDTEQARASLRKLARAGAGERLARPRRARSTGDVAAALERAAGEG